MPEHSIYRPFQTETLIRQPEIKSWAIMDLDGVILRWVKSDIPDRRSQTEFLTLLDTWQKNGLGIAILTNRPPGAMPAIAYEMGVNYGTWVTESGGSMYNVYRHKAAINPRWIPALPDIHQLRQVISEQVFDHPQPENVNDAQFEPGMGYVKTVVIPPENYNPTQYLQTVLAPKLEAFTDRFTMTAGKAVDIDPIGLSKADGMEALLMANGINPSRTPTIWIADHTRDIAAASELLEHGGLIAAVGNASPDYQRFTREHRGILAPSETSYHGSVVAIIDSFLRLTT